MCIIRKPVSDLLGLKFNRLEVVEYLGKGKYDKHYWKCKCECGGEVTLPTYRITGKTTSAVSCGCFRKEKMLENRADPTKHGLHTHKLYSVYHSMLQRCYNPRSQRYKYYGSSGISVCADWREDFLSFYKWALENGYQEGLSIDRVDSSENYCPENCEWVTVSENSRRMNEARNRRREI